MARTYTEEFKKECLEYLKAHPDMPRKEAAENLGIPKDTLYGWYKADRKKTNPDAYDENGRMTEEEKEIIRLRRELRATKDALEILKKAISILGD